MKRVAIVTGASSGIGRETAKALAAARITVYDFSRRHHPLEGVTHLATDVTDPEAVRVSVSEVFKREGQIDILVNNAGFGISGAVEFTDLQNVKHLFDVNVFGQIAVTNEVLPIMRLQRQGRIVNISSVAAICPIPFQTFYSATKSAVMTYSMALANEVMPFGVRVSAVLPGDIRSGFTDARAKSVKGDDVYQGKISRSVGRMEKDERKGLSSEAAGKAIAHIALSKRNKPVYVLGFGYRCISLLVKILPTSIVNWLIKLLYAN